MRTLNSSPLEARRVAESLARYRKDFRLFGREQLKISGNPMTFWPCQLPLLESIERQMEQYGFARVVWLKARQVGASTLAQAIVAWRTMLWPNVNAIVIADEAERSRSLFEISKSFYEQMDEEIRPVGRYITKRELVFGNPSHLTRKHDPGLRSRIVVDSAHKKNIAIGANWQIAHLSEAARFPDPSFVLDGVIPAVHTVPGTLIIMESSAEMAGTWYRDFCERAQKKANGFEFMFVPWFLQPEYSMCPLCYKVWPNACVNPDHERIALKKLQPNGDERRMMVEFGLTPKHIAWMRHKLGEMDNDWDIFRQNYPLFPEDAWVTPGAQAFPSKEMRDQKENIQAPIRRCEVHAGPAVMDNPQGRMLVWKTPQVGKHYDIGVDVSAGVGRDDVLSELDASVAIVIERGSGEQVAEWVSKATDPFELAQSLYWLGTYFNTAQMAIETNGIGGATNMQMSKLGYSNVYIWRYRDEVVPRYSKKTGWETNTKSKSWLVGFAIHELVNRRVIIRSELLLREMQTFLRKDVDVWEAAPGEKDDRVMAWMISVLVSDDENFERYFGMRKSMDFKDKEKPKLLPEPWEADLEFQKILKGGIDRLDKPWD